MKNIFRLKFKLHRLVNILFYLIFFGLGFLLGGGFFDKEKISGLFNIFNF